MVPGGGPALDGRGWIASRHPTNRRRIKPYLVDNVLLGRVFRQKFVDGLRRLVRQEKLRLEKEWARLLDPPRLEAWLAEISASDWNVFVEGPPHGKSAPEQVLKYLARYLTGGPISDRRIIRDEGGRVTFWARSKDKQAGNPPREAELPGHEFLRRWCLHILPKGYTKSRCYGGYHGTKRRAYLDQCRQLLSGDDGRIEQGQAPTEIPAELRQPSLPKCPRCHTEMTCIQTKARPSWKEVFDRRSYSSHPMPLPVDGGKRYSVPDD